MRIPIGLLLALSFSLSAQNWVEVRNEPRHKPVFENNYIRLLNVIIPPGDTSLYHRHYLPSVFVFLEHTDIGMQDLGAAPGRSVTVMGQTWFSGYEKGPHIHRAWTNDKKTNLHAIDIEVLRFDSIDNEPVLKNPAIELVSESKPVRIYRLKVEQGGTIKLKLNNNPVVIIPYTGSVKAGSLLLKRASYRWWDKKSVTFSSAEKDDVFCYLYEIRI
jgi:hypothetical protein